MTEKTAELSVLLPELIRLHDAAREAKIIFISSPDDRLGVNAQIPFVLIPPGAELQSVKPLLNEYQTRPERIINTARLTTLESFCEYLMRFRRLETAVFVNAGASPSMTALIDYHGMGANAEASFCAHSALYEFPLSEPFRAWVAAGDNLMDHGRFAELLHDRQYDVENPPPNWQALPTEELQTVLDLLNIRSDPGAVDSSIPALLPAAGAPIEESDGRPRTACEKLKAIKFGRVQDLNALARGVEVIVGQKFTQGTDPRTGARTLAFTEEHHGATNPNNTRITIPDVFLIYIPVFDGGSRQMLPVRLFYRVRGGSINWGIKLIDAPRLVRRAVDSAAQSVRTLAEGASVPVIYGDPGEAV